MVVHTFDEKHGSRLESKKKGTIFLTCENMNIEFHWDIISEKLGKHINLYKRQN